MWTVDKNINPFLTCPPTNYRRTPCLFRRRLVWITTYRQSGRRCRPIRRLKTERCGGRSCSPGRTVYGLCHPVLKQQLVTRFINVRRRRRCREIVSSRSYIACNCISSFLNVGPCNMCKGKRSITRIIEEVVHNRCIRRMIPKYEDCQKCFENPRSETKCIGNTVLRTTTSFNKLDGCYKCVPSQRTHSTVIQCKDSVQVNIVNKCEKHLTKFLRRPVNCNCITEIRKSVELICCPPAQILNPICRKKKRFHRIRHFKLTRGRCIPEYKETAENIKCRRRKTISFPRCDRKRNGKFFCKATGVYQIEVIDSNCKCQTKTVKYSRTCCCKNSEIRTSCNKELGILTKTLVTYRLLRMGRESVCVKSETKSSSKITCKPVFTTKPGKTDSNCRRMDTIYITKRVACEIRTIFFRNDFKVVCCRPQTKTVRTCIFNNLVTTLFEKVVKNNICVEVLKSKNERKIKCPPPSIVTSECIKNKVETITTSFVVHQCKCKLQKITKILPCKCRPGRMRTQYLPCNRNTCKKLTIEYYQNELCTYYKKICVNICCCPPPKILEPQCDPSTGNLKLSFINNIYSEKNSTCLLQKTMKIKNIICKKTEKTLQSCNKERPHFRKIITLSYRLSHQKCQCRQISSVSWQCCSAPPSRVIRNCRSSSIYEETTTYKCSKDKSRLISEKKFVIKPVQCPALTKKKWTKHISPRKYNICHHYYEIKKCKCVKRERCTTFIKWCDKPRKTVQCLNGKKSLTTITDFILSRDKRNCLSSTRKYWKTIICKDYTKTRKTPCRNSIYHIITENFRVRKCKCQKINHVIRKKICKCPETKVERVCLGKVTRIISTKYTKINDEKCIKNKIISYKNIVCKSQSIKEGHCNTLTNKKPITKTYYDIINCRCIKKTLTTHLLCPCPKKPDRYNRISQLSRCTEMVKVFRYTTVNDACSWKLVATYQDEKCCFRKSVKRICVAHNIHRTIIKKCVLNVITGLFPYRKSKIYVQIIDKAVKCNRDYSYNEPCIDGVQIRVDCKFVKRECKCVKRCKSVVTRPLNCCRKSFCKRTCRGNQEYLTCFSFKPDRIKCVEFKSEKVVLHQCKPHRHAKCTKANIYKENGYYKSCVIKFSVYRNCKCERISNTEEILTHCRSPIPTSQCRKNRKSIILTSFIPKNNKCEIKTTEQFSNIDCRPYRISKRDKLHSIEYTLIYYQIRNCHCSRKTLVRYTPKCKMSTVNRKCRNNQMITTYTSFNLQVSRSKLFPEVNNDLRVERCQKIKRIDVKPIRCYSDIRLEICMVKENRLKIEHQYNIPENCKCKRRIKVTYRKNCKNCRKPIVTLGPCLPRNLSVRGYQIEKTIKWQIMSNNKCKQSRSSRLMICRCERSTESKECKKGVLIHKRTSYSLPNCQPNHQITYRRSPCYNNNLENKWILIKISRCRYPGEFTVKHFERFNFDPSNCLCKRVTKSVKTTICCRPCRFKTECLNNKLVYTRICEQPRNLICKTIIRKTPNPIKCPKPIHDVIGGCRRSPIRMRLTTFVSERCRCIKKVSFYPQYKRNPIRQCVGDKWKITNFDYELIRKRCIQIPPRIVFVSIICSSKVKIVDRKIDKCTFSRSHFVKRVSKCKCVDRLLKTEILHYECCQKPTFSKKCLNNRIKVAIKVNYRLMNFRCYPIKTVTRIPTDCSRIQTERPIPTSLCTFKLIKYAIQYVNCKCKTKEISEKRNLHNCCHHLKPYKRQKCDTIRGIQHTVYVTFSRQNFACKKVRKVVSIPINCETTMKGCVKRSTPCQNETQTIELFCNKRKDCGCVKTRVKKHKVCCGIRNISSWVESRWCIKTRNHYYRIKETYVLKFSTNKNMCVATKIDQKSIICKCRPSHIIQRCLNDIYNLIISISYVKDPVKNDCIKYVREKRKIVSGCPKNITILISIEKDKKKPGWGTKTYLTTYPKNCRCEQLKTIRHVILDCRKAYADRIRKYCKQNNVVVRETLEPKCFETSVIWIKKENFTPLLKCGTLYHRKGPCFRFLNNNALEARYDTWLRDVIKNCTVIQTIVKTSLIHCKCRHSHREVKCVGSKRIFTDYSYINTGGRCHRLKRDRAIEVKCPVKPIITKSKCKNNIYKLTITKFHNINCRCIPRCSECRTCHCRCPRDSIVRKCSRHYLINVITTKYKKKYCRCVKEITTMKIAPKCPPLIGALIGKCESRGIHQYSKITVRTPQTIQNECKCIEKVAIKYRICKCSLLEERRERCFSPTKVIEIWAWRIDRKANKCTKFVKFTQSFQTVCPKPIEKRICDYRLQLGRLVRVSHYLKNCKCISSRNERKIPCLCKNRKSVLVKNGACNAELTCRRISLYKHFEARGDKCVPVYLKRIFICCCPPDQKMKLCKNDMFINLNISFALVNGSCIKKVAKRKDIIKCSKAVTITRGKCDASGYKMISYYRERIRKCKCVREKFKTKICACQCGRDRTTVTCDLSTRTQTNVTVRYSLSNCTCVPNKLVVKTKVICPQGSVSVSQCLNQTNRNHRVIITTKTKYRLESDCECKKIVTRTKKLCCPSEKTIRRYCDKSMHHIVVNTTMTVLRKCVCVKVSFVRKIVINCNEKWVPVGSRICQPIGPYGILMKTFVKFVLDKCNCRQVRKTQRCNCFCSGPPSISVCRNEAIHFYRYKYSFIKCKCKRIVQLVNVKSVKCNKIPPKLGACFQENNLCVRNKEHQDIYSIGCKCIKKVRLERISCITCPVPQNFTTRVCNKASNFFILTNIGWWISPDGLIRKNEVKKSVPVSCRTGENCITISKCDDVTLTEMMECQIRTLVNCQCRLRRERRKGICKCKRDQVKESPCEKELRKITVIRHNLIRLPNGMKRCEKQISTHERCCCPPNNPIGVIQCIENKIIRITKRCTYDSKMKTCNTVFSRSDETPSCSPSSQVESTVFNATTNMTIVTTINKTLINCKCNISRNVESHLCTCPDDRIEEKCLENISETWTHTYILENGNYKAVITKTKKFIKCNKPRTQSFRCNLKTCKKIERSILYDQQNCECNRRIVDKEVDCCCPQKKEHPEICLAQNTLKKTVEWYKLNKNIGKCIKFEKNEEKEIKCLVRPIIHRSECSHHLGNGIYTTITTTTESKSKCACIRKVDKQYQICRCDKVSESTRCENNQYITINHFYQKFKANSPYDYKCERKVKIFRFNPKPCPPTTRVLKSCSRKTKIYIETFYTIKDCLCVKNEKEVTEIDRECDTKVCFELPDDSECLRFKNGVGCSSGFALSTCPMTCKICEVCKKPNDRNCEENNYNNVTVWARKI